MTEREEPYILAVQDNKTGEIKLSGIDPRGATRETPANDQNFATPNVG